jgi:allophanate hydrolase subunit 1
MTHLRFIPASDSSLLVVVSEQISLAASARVVSMFHALRAARAPFVVDLHPAYTRCSWSSTPQQRRTRERTAPASVDVL